MMLHFVKNRLGALLILLSVGFGVNQVIAAEQYHLVVDVSGSMQRIDPQKERIVALKKFINQLPNGSRAGVWTYARQVNMLVAPGVVNDQWRAKALKAIGTIGGYGPYANLPNALAQATHTWRGSPSRSGRNVVLLTANGVKSSDSAQQNQSARQQLLTTLLPQLEKNHIKVYALGFSRADKALLQELADNTQGAYQVIPSSAEITPVFASLSKNLGFKANASSQRPAKTAILKEEAPKEIPRAAKAAALKPAETTAVPTTQAIAAETAVSPVQDDIEAPAAEETPLLQVSEATPAVVAPEVSVAATTEMATPQAIVEATPVIESANATSLMGPAPQSIASTEVMPLEVSSDNSVQNVAPVLVAAEAPPIIESNVAAPVTEMVAAEVPVTEVMESLAPVSISAVATQRILH